MQSARLVQTKCWPYQKKTKLKTKYAREKTLFRAKEKEQKAETRTKEISQRDVNNDDVDDNRKNESKIAYFE